MDWIVHDNISKYRIAESDTLLELKECLKNKKCKVALSECEWFWRIKPDSNGMLGCIGATGCVGVYGITSAQQAEQWNLRPAWDSKDVSVSITFPMSKENAKSILDSKLSLTKNMYDKTLTPWTTQEKTEYLYYTCGVYKKEGFDEAYKTMHKLKPHLTEKDFAYDYNDEWDADLVDIRLYDTNDCIATTNKYECINTNIMMVTLTLLEIDVQNNMHFIKNIVS